MCSIKYNPDVCGRSYLQKLSPHYMHGSIYFISSWQCMEDMGDVGRSGLCILKSFTKALANTSHVWIQDSPRMVRFMPAGEAASEWPPLSAIPPSLYDPVWQITVWFKFQEGKNKNNIVVLMGKGKMLKSLGIELSDSSCWFWTSPPDYVINPSWTKVDSLIGWFNTSSFPKFFGFFLNNSAHCTTTPKMHRKTSDGICTLTWH